MRGPRNTKSSNLLRRRAPARELQRRAGIEDANRRLLLWFVVPLWIGSGLADWLCHRRSDIEHTSSTHEAAIHAAMMTEAGVPVMLGLFAEANAGVIAATLSGLGLHQATAIWDVAYAESRREVTPTEQHVHGLLEQVPVMATAFLIALHWDQTRSLFRLSSEKPRFRLQPKRQPLPPRTRALLLTAAAAFGAAPYAEEILRCYRVDKQLTAHGEPEPPLAAGGPAS